MSSRGGEDSESENKVNELFDSSWDGVERGFKLICRYELYAAVLIRDTTSGSGRTTATAFGGGTALKHCVCRPEIPWRVVHVVVQQVQLCKKRGFEEEDYGGARLQC